jgi:hypothetical protein
MGKIIARSPAGARPAAYIIRNGRVAPASNNVERKTFAIAGRALQTMIMSNGVGNLYRIYTTVQRDGIDFNLALIGEEFKEAHRGALGDSVAFDRGCMTKLFEYGRAKARAGYAWHKVPPGFSP